MGAENWWTTLTGRAKAQRIFSQRGAWVRDAQIPRMRYALRITTTYFPPVTAMHAPEINFNSMVQARAIRDPGNYSLCSNTKVLLGRYVSMTLADAWQDGTATRFSC